MITEQTVFVLGAGANCSYGFPSGESLKAEIVSLVQSAALNMGLDSLDPIAEKGHASFDDIGPSRCSAFAEALQKAGQPSIDAFLAANKHMPGFDIIGRSAIARVLMKYENNALIGGGDDWLSYVFKIMLEGAIDPNRFFTENKVSFITFNYDRYLERFFFERIKSSYGLSDERTASYLRMIPIHHVYGSLGPYTYVHAPGEGDWVESALSIKTIYDLEKNHEVVSCAEALLKEAVTICFLGFGFHRENIELLGLPGTLSPQRGIVASSRFEIYDHEWYRLKRHLGNVDIHVSHQSQKCLESIRNLPIF